MRRHGLRAATITTGAVASAFALTLAFSPLSGATTRAAATSKTPTLSSLEKTLKGLEKPPSSSTTVTENGSSLFTPLFQAWAAAPPFSSITIQPTSSGSGTGVSDAIAGTTNIGASDPYLPPTDNTVINIPVVVAGQEVLYNIPGIKSGTHLRLTPSVLAGIYSGGITNWDTSAITKLNPGVKIPSLPIVTLHRSDSSGDTFLFLTYLNAGDPGSFVSSVGGPQNAITWPNAPGALAAKGNAGMLSTLQTTPGGIAYIGLSFLRAALQAGLQYSYLQNGDKNFVGPTPVNIADEVAAFKNIPANGAISLEYAKGKAAKFGYPIVNFEYAIVQPNQSSSTTAQAIKALLAWGMDPTGGAKSSFISPLYFQTLPPVAMQVAINLLKSVN
jgi:phosphate transport system substrate-binding protein